MIEIHFSWHWPCRYLSMKKKNTPIGHRTKKLCPFFVTGLVFVCFGQHYGAKHEFWIAESFVFHLLGNASSRNE